MATTTSLSEMSATSTSECPTPDAILGPGDHYSAPPTPTSRIASENPLFSSAIPRAALPAPVHEDDSRWALSRRQ